LKKRNKRTTVIIIGMVLFFIVLAILGTVFSIVGVGNLEINALNTGNSFTLKFAVENPGRAEIEAGSLHDQARFENVSIIVEDNSNPGTRFGRFVNAKYDGVYNYATDRCVVNNERMSSSEIDRCCKIAGYDFAERVSCKSPAYGCGTTLACITRTSPKGLITEVKVDNKVVEFEQTGEFAWRTVDVGEIINKKCELVKDQCFIPVSVLGVPSSDGWGTVALSLEYDIFLEKVVVVIPPTCTNDSLVVNGCKIADCIGGEVVLLTEDEVSQNCDESISGAFNESTEDRLGEAESLEEQQIIIDQATNDPVRRVALVVKIENTEAESLLDDEELKILEKKKSDEKTLTFIIAGFGLLLLGLVAYVLVRRKKK